MKIKLNYAITLALAIAASAHAGSATWNVNPDSGDWNTAANWTPATVPNGPEDVATLSTSSISTVSLLNFRIEVASLIFDAAASNYAITVSSDSDIAELTISGDGILNNSGTLQEFFAQGDQGQIHFTGNAAAGTLTQFTMRGGEGSDRSGGFTFFNDQSSADHATFIVNGPSEKTATAAKISFFDASTAGSATFLVRGNTGVAGYAAALNFFQSSTAGNATLTAQGGGGPSNGVFGLGGVITFWDGSTGGNATCVAAGGTKTGAQGGIITFAGHANAGQATLVAESGSNGGEGGRILFVDSGQATEARVELLGNASLAIAGENPPGIVNLGSLEGDGKADTSNNNHLAVGANGLSTEFSGVIQGTGSLEKLGSGSLTLSGANTYTAGTTVTAGVLKVANVAGSATGTGPVNVETGTLAGDGTIEGDVTIGRSTGGADTMISPSGKADPQPGILTVLGHLTFNPDSLYTYTYRAKSNKASTDLVVADGVTINGSASIAFSGKIKGRLTPGLVFTLISNISSDPITGTFSNLVDGSMVVLAGNTLQANYEGGDGNDLVLTVLPYAGFRRQD